MLIIGIAGGSGSGKTTVVKAITDQLKEKVVVIPQDSYYKDLSHLTEQEKRDHNFDHPDSIDFDLLCQQLKELKDVVDLQEFWVNKGDPDHIKGLDSRFHELVYKFSGSMIFYDTLIPLHKKTQKYRRVSVENRNRAEQSMIEHRAVYNAIADRNGELAEKLLVEHIRNAANNILKGDI